MLRLEHAPLVSMDVEKGKGIVFDFDERKLTKHKEEALVADQKLLHSAIQSGMVNSRLPLYESGQLEIGAQVSAGSSASFCTDPTGYRIGFS